MSTTTANAPAVKADQKPTYERMADASGEAVADLVRQHWLSIESEMIAAEKKKMAVSIGLKFERVSEANYKLTTKIGYGLKKSDEREDFIGIEDPKQQKLGLADLKEGRA